MADNETDERFFTQEDEMTEEELKEREAFVREYQVPAKTVSKENEADFHTRNQFPISPFHPQDGNENRSKIYGILVTHFSWVEELGQGAFAQVKHGRVRKGVQQSNGLVRTFGITDYAIKIVSKRTITVNRQRAERVSAIFAEKHAHMDCDHPFIIKCYDTMRDQKNIYFVLELARKMDLCEYVIGKKGLSVPVARYYAATAVAVMEYMHAKGYVHRDLKPENFMLMEDMRPKVGDFGCVRILGDNVEYPGAFFTGTPNYMAPESINKSRDISDADYPATDVYSLAPLLFFLLTGKLAFEGGSEWLVFQAVQAGELQFPENFDDAARDLIEKCLQTEPSARPSIAELKQHPFFEEIQWDCLADFDPMSLISPGEIS